MPASPPVDRGALGAVDRRADRARPRPELGEDDLDALDRRRDDPAPQLGPDRLDDERARARPASAEDDPVGRQDRDRVREADPEVAADLGEPGDRALVTRPRRLDRRLRGSRCRTRPRPGRRARTPRRSHGCRSRTTVRRGRSSGARTRRPVRGSPARSARRARRRRRCRSRASARRTSRHHAPPRSAAPRGRTRGRR